MAVTGIAGPGGGSAAKPVGLVHIAVAGPSGAVSEAVRVGSHRPRATIQTLSIGEALDRLRRQLAACPPPAQGDGG
jgi:nicotinamide-nucleotide amidase